MDLRLARRNGCDMGQGRLAALPGLVRQRQQRCGIIHRPQPTRSPFQDRPPRVHGPERRRQCPAQPTPP